MAAGRICLSNAGRCVVSTALRGLAMVMALLLALLLSPFAESYCSDSSQGAATSTDPVPSVQAGGEPKFFPRVDTEPGVSLHKEMFLLPYSWSTHYDGDKTEVMFQLSAKLRIMRSGFFLAYTQKSFWQAYNRQSAPFRDTNFNPEVFWRLAPSNSRLKHWGFDIGLEHESNGKAGEESRSWNRAYFAVHNQRSRILVYLKAWYRVDREKECHKDPNGQELASCQGDPAYDDNPDIMDFMGYGEADVYVRLTKGDRPQMLHAMVRGNPATAKGLVSLDYSHPSGSKDLHWFVSVWSGYGESLLDYNRRQTRAGAGILLRR